MDKSVIAIGLSILAFLWGVYVYRSNRNVEAAKTIEEFGKRLVILETQVSVFWKGVSYTSAQALHSPHTKELDLLLEKFQRDEIQSEKDLHRLKVMLKDVADTDTDTMRRKLALDILNLIHIRFEIGGDVVESFRRRH